MKHSSHAIAMLIRKYRAVVQNLRSCDSALHRYQKGICAAALLVSLAVSPGLAAAGETFTYTGDPADPHLQTFSSWANALGPIDPANTDYNTVTINYTSGFDPSNAYGGWSNGASGANHNTVNMLNGTMTHTIYGAQANGSGDANYNTVNLFGGTVNAAVEGGLSGISGSANYNTVNINGGTVNMVMGGESTGTGNTNYNTVNISGGTVNSQLISGLAVSGDSNYNTVNISGGTLGGDVDGGVSTSGSANYNTINISGSPNLTGATLNGGSGVTSSTGNTLNVRGYSGSVVGVQNFQNYNFYLPSSVANGATILTVTGGTATDLAGTTVAITGIASGGASLHAGDVITLISSTTNAPSSFSGNVLSGLMKYNFNYVAANTAALEVQVTGVQAAPQAKALSEGRLAAVTNLAQGQDLLAGQGMSSAIRAIPNNATDTFAALSGAHNRYETGSYVDMNGVALLVGIGKKNATESGATLSGFFLETGKGNYSSYSNFVNMASIRGDGDSRYFGAGYLGRNQQENGRYVEGSVRAGQVKSTFRSGDLFTATGKSADYDASTPYYGMHIGIGREKTVSGNLTLDTYSKFLWTHQNASSVVTAGGDPVNFEAVNSERGQLGAKLSREVDEHTSIRTGLAYQYEFGAKASASTYGYSIDTPSLKGGSGIVEFGVTKKYANSSIDLSLQGFSGKTKGIAGNIEATWKF
ncbi:MAG: autotransporter domain-containing protein [Negativicutes bacterium]|nr:autotransporter domain-containing protein [Negativicutes bacterium]